ncbi:glutamine amidotransferase [Nocardia farcinica]|uniref:DJ-1/PfpI domain-containing protein n=3 Tax=Nocardia farcinica TaxID=37329 RepID=Q5YNP2_NOCFA|nr:MULTISPECIES: type 1 glutamine amidotransferase family protein [Nocardia]AXK87402.1 glutamine amidotransferase [Nocardia farcinica]MBA4858246.1 glutamine amidotransferase [Nocardia farcinica]MBC9817033.1 glutamine amidotransferase [Nocardia farcinica]MBF6068858.1 glutamine amidotransferase [Nocardia farcinica]MBF6186820.1 glutamine amidotransferase [Nocardia farcinica]
METRTVHTAVYDTLADWEVGAAIAHINNPEWQRNPGSFEVRTVGLTRDPIRTKGGVRIVPDLALGELTPEQSAGLILPGADTWVPGDLAPFAAAAAGFLDAGVPVAAICGATYGLAAAGLLDTRKHTSNAPQFLAASGYAGADHYVEQPAVSDGVLVTATGTAPFEFAREVLRVLDVYEPHVLDAWYRLFAHNDVSAFLALQDHAAAE